MKKDKTSISPEFETTLKNWDKYKGHVVMVIENKIFATKKPSQVKKYVETIERKFHKTPLIAHIPQADSLILFYESYISV